MKEYAHSHADFIRNKLLSSIVYLASYDTEIEALDAK